MSAAELAGWVDRLGAVDVAAGDAGLIDQIREFGTGEVGVRGGAGGVDGGVRVVPD